MKYLLMFKIWFHFDLLLIAFRGIVMERIADERQAMEMSIHW